MRIVRGIDYYTGIVFEFADSENPKLGSLAGGGRYDALPRLFGRPDLSATGAAGGVEREAMSVRSGAKASPVAAYVAFATPDVYANASGILARLRESDVACDISPMGRSLGKQLEDASAMGARWAFIVGRQEVAAGVVTLRDLTSRNEEKLSLDEALKRVTSS